MASREIRPVFLKELNAAYALEGVMLKLKLQYFGYLMGSVDSLEMSDAGEIEGKRRRRWQRMRELDSTTDSMDKYLSKLRDSEGQERLSVYSPWGHKDLDTT